MSRFLIALFISWQLLKSLIKFGWFMLGQVCLYISSAYLYFTIYFQVIDNHSFSHYHLCIQVLTRIVKFIITIPFISLMSDNSRIQSRIYSFPYSPSYLPIHAATTAPLSKCYHPFMHSFLSSPFVQCARCLGLGWRVSSAPSPLAARGMCSQCVIPWRFHTSTPQATTGTLMPISPSICTLTRTPFLRSGHVEVIVPWCGIVCLLNFHRSSVFSSHSHEVLNVPPGVL